MVLLTAVRQLSLPSCCRASKNLQIQIALAADHKCKFHVGQVQNKFSHVVSLLGHQGYIQTLNDVVIAIIAE